MLVPLAAASPALPVLYQHPLDLLLLGASARQALLGATCHDLTKYEHAPDQYDVKQPALYSANAALARQVGHSTTVIWLNLPALPIYRRRAGENNVQIYRTEGTGRRGSALRIAWGHLGSPSLLRLVLFEHLLSNDHNRVLHKCHRHFGKVRRRRLARWR